MEGLKEHPSGEKVEETLEKLSNITANPDDSQGEIFSGEIEKVTDILDDIANVSQSVTVDDNQAKV